MSKKWELYQYWKSIAFSYAMMVSFQIGLLFVVFLKNSQEEGISIVRKIGLCLAEASFASMLVIPYTAIYLLVAAVCYFKEVPRMLRVFVYSSMFFWGASDTFLRVFNERKFEPSLEVGYVVLLIMSMSYCVVCFLDQIDAAQMAKKREP
ncbi:hypothetical protein [Aliiroseovarius crassostreae]|uniref:hypothetical protein n=1 Tax=Aliiroseovarius crassostreae TaxID=154981 RepID=UPI0021FD50EF|nr:hypothetical protein [Aliiroseovarius crassostreae]UWQ06673.1 hypothetical protein K3X22_15395 [Aliiroseovarius crassostreae]